MKNDQTGFSHLLLILMIGVVSVIGFVGWRVVSSQKNDDQKITPSSSQQEPKKNAETKVKDVAWLTYKNEEAGFTFKYPKNWQNSAKDTFRYDDGTFGGVEGTVVSPTGNEVTWVYQIAGGKGGQCEPNADDTPFALTNKCSTKQILSVEKAQSIKAPTSKPWRNLFQDSLYITKTKYLSSWESNGISYQICLDPAYTTETDTHPTTIPETGTTMGLLFPCSFWSTGFNAKYVAKDEADLDSADAKTAIAIMKTFDSL